MVVMMMVRLLVLVPRGFLFDAESEFFSGIFVDLFRLVSEVVDLERKGLRRQEIRFRLDRLDC